MDTTTSNGGYLQEIQARLVELEPVFEAHLGLTRPSGRLLSLSRHIADGWFSFPRFRQPEEFPDFTGRMRDCAANFKHYQDDWDSYFDWWVGLCGRATAIKKIRTLLSSSFGEAESRSLYFELLHVFSSTPTTWGDRELWLAHKKEPSSSGIYSSVWTRNQRQEPWTVNLSSLGNGMQETFEFRKPELLFRSEIDPSREVFFNTLYPLFIRPTVSVREPQDADRPASGKSTLVAIALNSALPRNDRIFLGWLYLKLGDMDLLQVQGIRSLEQLKPSIHALEQTLLRLAIIA